jgi:hypothetical protein
MLNQPLEKTFPTLSSLRLFHLGDLFERIIRSWGACNILHLESDLTETDYMPMERMALLSGTLRGFLVLRSSMEFLDWLGNRKSDSPLGRYNEAEMFEELLSLLTLYLFHDFWNPESFEIGPIHPFPSVPGDWPKGKNQVSCSLLVEGHPVEIRLWLDTAAHC